VIEKAKKTRARLCSLQIRAMRAGDIGYAVKHHFVLSTSHPSASFLKSPVPRIRLRSVGGMADHILVRRPFRRAVAIRPFRRAVAIARQRLIVGSAAEVAATHLVGLSAKAQSDSQGFRRRCTTRCRPAILKSPLYSNFTYAANIPGH